MTQPASLLRPAAARRVVIDANLLFVFVVAQCDCLGNPAVKGCSEYEASDLDSIERHLAGYAEVVVTAHVLTEVSNLIGRCREHIRVTLYSALEAIAKNLTESYCESATAMQTRCYQRLGLTDATLRLLAANSVDVFTNDRDLHLELARAGLPSVHYDSDLRPHADRK